MKVNIILFNRGSGGNFLARILTLDPTTVCLGSVDIDSAQDRCEYYCYSELTQPPNTPLANGLSTWVDAELNRFYFPFTRGIEQLIKLNRTVIEPMHPDQYQVKSQLLGQDDQITLYYIDITGCESWVEKQIKHKIHPATRPAYWCDTTLNNIASSQQATPIKLKNIIESEYTFVSEYSKVCGLMKLKSYPDLALKIYKTWQKTWG
jgi:hypothetical protein